MKETDDLPVGNSLNNMLDDYKKRGLRIFRLKDAAIFISFLLVMLMLVILAGNAALALVFNFVDELIKVTHFQESPSIIGFEGTFVYALVFVFGTFIGRYIWLFIMSAFLAKSDISPFLAYGYPIRKLSHFDQFLLNRLYKR